MLCFLVDDIYVIFEDQVFLNIDSIDRLTTTPYFKRDDFDFAIVNFPFLCSNIPLSSVYGVSISQLIGYARTCFVLLINFKTRQTTEKNIDIAGL
jgi:hypothetical protein